MTYAVKLFGPFEGFGVENKGNKVRTAFGGKWRASRKLFGIKQMRFVRRLPLQGRVLGYWRVAVFIFPLFDHERLRSVGSACLLVTHVPQPFHFIAPELN